MSTQDNHSEIARRRQRIAEEYEAAIRGLIGFASDSAKHQFATKRMEQIGTCLGSGRWPRRWKRCNRGQEGED
jgi:hypothetical protein